MTWTTCYYEKNILSLDNGWFDIGLDSIGLVFGLGWFSGFGFLVVLRSQGQTPWIFVFLLNMYLLIYFVFYKIQYVVSSSMVNAHLLNQGVPSSILNVPLLLNLRYFCPPSKCYFSLRCLPPIQKKKEEILSFFFSGSDLVCAEPSFMYLWPLIPILIWY